MERSVASPPFDHVSPTPGPGGRAAGTNARCTSPLAIAAASVVLVGCQQLLGDLTAGQADAASAADTGADSAVDSAVEGSTDASPDALDAAPSREASAPGDAGTESGAASEGGCANQDGCTVIGAACAGPATLVSCARNAQGCLYGVSSSPCNGGACTGAPGAASCCVNACTPGTTCASSRSLQTCAASDGGCTVASGPVTCGAGFVCERQAPAQCADPGWAEWPISNSSTDVSLGAPNLESYTDHGDGTVTDDVTGLMWQQTASALAYTWTAAGSYCPTVTAGGYTDWRLPTVIELASLLNFDDADFVNPVAFPPASSTAAPPTYWSSTQVAPVATSNMAWAVGSSVAAASEANTNFVRCVR